MDRKIKPSPLSKTDVRFWYDRLFKRGDSSDWQVQIGFAGDQERFPLKTPNKESAAAKAKEIYLTLHAKGWEATRALFKPWTNQVQRIDSPTVGEFLTAVETFGGINPITFKSYSRKFRRLVASVRKIAGDASRFHRGEGSAAWRKDVDAVQLAELTAADINRWKLNFVASKRGDALKQHHAETTAQSILRNSKSLFSARVLRRLQDAKVELKLPSPLPFADVEIGTPPRHRYTSTIDAEKLARDANKELPKQDPELLKIFLLAFAVGLRRGEIDKLQWAQINWSKSQINIVITTHGATKTDSSVAAVDVDPAVMALFKKFKSSATSEFVIESTVQPRPGANFHHYRADCKFKQLTAWLRDKGVNVQKPIHDLRKQFGSMVCEQFGLFAASSALRHADIRITRDHYIEKRGKIYLDVGRMLGGKN